MAIFAAAWILVLAGAVVIFQFVVPFSYFHSNFENSVAKGGMGTIVALLWLFAMMKMRDYFVARKILKRAVKEDNDH